jgi:transposase InsO family protein
MASLKKIISDRGPQFVARSVHALYKCLGIDAGLTTAYHPQANGQVEHKNQEVEIYLKLFTGKHQDDWADLLPTAEFVINSRLNSAMGTYSL